jgi:hypothetical protein
MNPRFLSALVLLTFLGVATGSTQKPPVGERCSRGAADTKTIQVSATFGQSLADVSRAIDSILPALGYALDSTVSSPGRWVSRVRTTWPQGTENESWHGAESPGVKVFVRATAKGDSTLFVVDAQAMCLLESAEVDAQPGSISGMLEMMAAVQVASSLSTAFKAK